MSGFSLPTKRPRSVSCLCSAAILLAGCTSYGGLTRDTMSSCIDEAGITGAYTATSTLRNDRMTFVVVPGPNVSDAQSEVANACIARAIASSPGTDAASGGPEQRTVVTTGGNTVRETYTYGTPPSGATAPPSATIRPQGICRLQMVGGTGYLCR